jgi:hypothetical protein
MNKNRDPILLSLIKLLVGFSALICFPAIAFFWLALMIGVFIKVVIWVVL